ncbi:Iron-sulfur cluster carrier protein [uncultured archaeon]|nr:Iron-sulfur cluster carrier protein [uncultured archaeon]
MTNKVFLVSGNAGQGKTTVAKNLAFCLKSFGFDVLLVDADVKTPKLGYHVGMPLAERTIQDVLLGVRKLEDAVYHSRSGLKLLLSSLNVVNVPHPSVLLSQLRKLADIVIIDVPAYDHKWYRPDCDLLLVTQPDFPSALETQKLSRGSKVLGLVINRMHSDNVDLSEGNIHQLLSMPVLGVIPEEPHMREALRHGYSIVEYHPELKASNVLKQIAAKLMNLEYQSPVQEVSLLTRLGL